MTEQAREAAREAFAAAPPPPMTPEQVTRIKTLIGGAA